MHARAGVGLLGGWLTGACSWNPHLEGTDVIAMEAFVDLAGSSRAGMVLQGWSGLRKGAES